MTLQTPTSLPVILFFVCAQNTPPSRCHPSFLNELTNVLSFPSSLVFDDNQKRQGICSSCHPSKCVCISSRDLRCFSMQPSQQRKPSAVYSLNSKIAGRFCIQQNQAMTLHSRAMTHQKKALSRTPFLLSCL